LTIDCGRLDVPGKKKEQAETKGYPAPEKKAPGGGFISLSAIQLQNANEIASVLQKLRF